MSIKNRFIAYFVLLSVFFLVIPFSVFPDDIGILWREEYQDLTLWEPFHFPKIKKYTRYTIESDGIHHYLRAESMASASALLFKNEFNIYEFPMIRWRWKVQNIYQKGNAKTKDGDDYPIRIYIAFKQDPEKTGFWEKAKNRVAEILYGRQPPHSTLNYIWANQEHEERVLTSTYTEKSKMILIQKGEKDIGTWQVHEADILEDYHMAFGEDPPALASIAIMNDSDNTGEQSVSYIDYIEIRKR